MAVGYVKWSGTFPLQNQTAEDIYKVLADSIVSILGCPFINYTDQGRNFNNSLFESIVCLKLSKSEPRHIGLVPTAQWKCITELFFRSSAAI